MGIFKAAHRTTDRIEILIIMKSLSINKCSIYNINFTKQLIRFILLSNIQVFFLCFNGSVFAAGDRIIKIGIYENAPKVFTDESGKPSGVFIDVIEQIAKAEGWLLEYIHGTWGEGLDRAKRGEIDLMPDVAYAADREKIYSFHKVPVLSSWYQVYAPRGSNIRSILDLKEKRILVLERSVQEAAFSKLNKGFGLNSFLIPVQDYNTMFQIVARGGADAAITNRFYGLMHAKKYGIEDTTLIFEPSDLFFAATRGDPKSLLNAIDSRLSDLKKDSRSAYYESLKRWTSEEVEFKLPEWLKILGMAAGVVLLISIVGSAVLKHQVNARTLELRKAKQLFMNIVEFLPDATFVIDQDKKIIAWNQACETMTGVKKETLLGRRDYAYAEPFFNERRPILIDLLDMPTPELEAAYKYIRLEDDRIYAESFIPYLRGGKGAHLWGVASPLFDQNGRRCGAIETIRDVTEQKIVENAMRESERKYRELVMLASTIILHWSHDGKIIYMNEFGLQFFGYSEDELIGSPVIGTIVPESDTGGMDLRSLMANICAEPQKYERNINENIRKNGERVWIDWANKIVLDENGKVKEILSIGTDITERKKAEDKIRVLNDELQRHAEMLENRVAERTAELAEAMEKAQAADRIKSAFLATMSHELRTPLNSIIGFTGIILQGLAGPLNEEQNKQLTMIQNSGRHLLSLINDVLDISKIEAGQLELSAKPFELRPSVEKMVKFISPLAEKKELGIQVDIAGDTGTMIADQRRIEQIILNLLNNAVKFTEKGNIRVSCRIEGGNCVLSVADTGIGIAREEMPKLFQPFYQIDSGTARKTEGTGLGLSICKKILDMMGGTIEVQSKPGEGSIFTITFPADTGVIT